MTATGVPGCAGGLKMMRILPQLSWEVPVDASAGDYRLTHFGYDNTGGAFSGVSDVVRIE